MVLLDPLQEIATTPLESPSALDPFQLIAEAGPVSIIVLIILAVFSLVSWAIILSKWIAFRKAESQTRTFLEIFRRSKKFSEVRSVCRQLRASPLVGVFMAGYNELDYQLRSHEARGNPMSSEEDEQGQSRIRSLESVARSLVRAFIDVFPHASAWSTELHEVLLVGSVEPFDLEGSRVAERFARPGIEQALTEVGIESPEALLGTWITGREGLEAFAGSAPPVTDDRPLIEHAAWVRRGEIRRVLPRLLELATEVPLAESDPLRPGVAGESQELRRFYQASLLALEGENEKAVALVRAVLSADPQNAYYRWIALGE